MDREINVEMTPRVVRWALFYRLRIVFFIMAIMLLALAWSSIIQARYGISWEWDGYIVPILFILFFAWTIFSSYRNTMSQIRKMKTPVIHYRFTDEFLYVNSDLASGQNSWAVFKGLRRNAKIWKIVTMAGVALILPVEQLDDELKAFLTAKLPSLTKPIWKRPFTIIATVLLLLIFLMYFLQYFRRD